MTAEVRAVADSLEEAGDRLLTFTRLPPSQWKSARTTNAVERLHEEFRRRIKTQTVLPDAETAPMLFWARFWPPVRSSCARSTAGRRSPSPSPPRPLISPHDHVTFATPEIAGCEFPPFPRQHQISAGAYFIETDEELIQGLSFPSAGLQARAADELALLPEGSAVVEMLSDYAVMRVQARACQSE